MRHLQIQCVIVVFVGTTRHSSFLDTYRSSFVSISSSSWRPLAKNSTFTVARVPRGCDIFRGKWVPDDDAGGEPYYTNRSCVVIQEHQNCMKLPVGSRTTRTNNV